MVAGQNLDETEERVLGLRKFRACEMRVCRMKCTFCQRSYLCLQPGVDPPAEAGRAEIVSTGNAENPEGISTSGDKAGPRGSGTLTRRVGP